MNWTGFSVLLLLASVLLFAGQATTALAEEMCQQRKIDAPLALNTIIVQELVKTVKVEKEVFECGPSAVDFTPTHIIDVEIFTEVIEQLRPDRGTILPVVKRFEVITCEKSIATASIVSCRLFTPPTLQAPPDRHNCQISPAQPSAPIAMNTAAFANGFVKTIMVQKELFTCPGGGGTVSQPALIIDLNTFTEIIERKVAEVIDLPPAPRRPTFKVVEKRIEQAICTKTPNGEVIACGVFAVPVE